ncbi:MAG TPA: BatD family protein, partial [Candidatus Ozemobacteraceae bacterium]|nr:BatD family protein [Candidatus Ozemobacteraceae bacterium]
ITVPRIPPMPGLDVVSQRSAQNMQIINGVGNIQVQTVAEILPKAPGKYTIPGFSLKGPDGKIHTTKAIDITVTEEKTNPTEAPSETSTPADETEDRGGISLVRGVFVVLGVILLVIVSPLAISYVLSLSQKRGSSRFATAENDRASHQQSGRSSAAGGGSSASTNSSASSGASREGPASRKPEPSASRPATAAPVTMTRPASIDFDAELLAIKRRNPDGGGDLHRETFDLLHRALVEATGGSLAALTPGELMTDLSRRAPPQTIKVIRRLAEEWEHLVYARMSPARPFAGVEKDVRAILEWARLQEK